MKDFFLSRFTGIICWIMAGILILGMVTTGIAITFSTDTIYTIGKVTVTIPRIVYGILNIIVLTGAIYLFSYFVRRVRHYRMWVTGVILFGFLLRVCAVLFWKIEIVSDFLTTYTLSQELRAVSVSSWGTVISGLNTIYANEWSAHMPFIIYQAVVLKIFGGTLLSLQIVNAAASAGTILFCVLIAQTVFGKRAGLITGFIMAIQPTFIFFSPVLSNQHIATLFFCAAVWLFISKPFCCLWMNIILAGVCTALSQLMRPEMYVVLIGAVCCLIYYIIKGEKTTKIIWTKIGMAAAFIGVFFLIMSAANSILHVSGMVTNSIFSGNTKYKILVGLNQESVGTWNEQDALTMYDEQKMDTVLKERLKDPAGNLVLILKKSAWQFGSYVYWWAMRLDTPENIFISQKIYRPLAQTLMEIVILLAVITMLSDKKSRHTLFPIYIILAGYFATFAIIEMQERYNYLLIPILIILASGTAEKIKLPVFRKKT